MMRIFNVVIMMFLAFCYIEDSVSFDQGNANTKNTSSDQDHANGIFSVGLTGGGFQSTSDNDPFAIDSENQTTPPIGTAKTINPQYHFGGGASIDYLLPNSLYDLKFTFFIVDNNDSASIENSGMVGTTLLPASYIKTYADSAVSKLKFSLDQFEFSSGVKEQISPTLMIHPRLGLLYLNVTDNQLTNYTGQDLGHAIGRVSQKSSFNRFAPLFGLDAQQNIYKKSFVFVNLSYSPTVGTIHSEYNASILDDSVFPAHISTKTSNSILSYFQSELGLGCDFNIHPKYAGDVRLGYSFNQLFGATEHESLIDSSAGSLLTSSTNNVGFQGPFARASLALG